MLLWICSRTPGWVTPDFMSALGVGASILVAVSYWLTWTDPLFLWVASFGILLHWFGDSMDGTLARFRNIERPKYGYFIDHTLDAFSEAVIALGIGLSPYVRMEYSLLALSGYLLVSLATFIRASVTGEFKLAYGKLGPTEVRLIIILANVVIFFVGNPLIETAMVSVRLYDSVALALAVGLFVVFAGTATNVARKLRRDDSSRGIDI
jgi:phosphatidylglycerophosphate synthase